MKKLLLLILLAGASPAFADLDITVTSGATAPTPIAVVPFGQPPDVNVDIAQIVAADLDRSGLFKSLPRGDMLEKPTDQSQVNFRNWRAVGSQDLVIGTVQRTGAGGIAVSFRLLDVYHSDDPQQVLLLGKDGVTVSDEAHWRSAAHRVADMIYERLTGVHGYFDTQIAYVTATGARDARRYQLMIADSDGENPHPVATSREPLLSPAWSPDGKRIAYAGYEHGNMAVYIQTPATGELKRFVGEPGINGSPAFSPDGRQLAVTLSFQHNPDIYVIDIASGARRRLTTDSAIDDEPAWSPDGSTIAFISDRGGSPQIYTMSASGGGAKRLTFQGKRNEKPEYSPDGKSLALVNLEGSSYRIGVLDLQSGSLKILSDGSLDEGPSFAPNGAAVIYTKQGQRGSELAMVSVDGRIKQSLRQAGDVREPAWSPYAQ